MGKQHTPPRIGMVSLGCPKATADSERILTRLRAEGYLISASYQDADLVIVNTCGFIDSAVEESLDAIGEALAENGKGIATHRCTFCIIPSLRGNLVSRQVGDVMQEAQNLVNAGVKELLVISQDTSAYGVDVKYRTGFWGGRPLKSRMTEVAAGLGELGLSGENSWVRPHY